MACIVGQNVIMCGPFGYPAMRDYRTCYECNRTTRQAVRYDGMYYGTTEWCLDCGNEWQDGGKRPAGRGAALARWMGAGSRSEFLAWVEAHEREYFDFEESA